MFLTKWSWKCHRLTVVRLEWHLGNSVEAAPSSCPFSQTSRNCQKQLCKNSEQQNFIATKWMLKQEKGNLAMVAKVCSVFTCPCSIPSLLWGSLEGSSPYCEYWFWKKKSRYYNLLCLYILTYLASTWRTDRRCSSMFLLIQKSNQKSKLYLWLRFKFQSI